MRIVILTYESYQANLMTQALLKAYPDVVVGIVSSEVIVAGKNTWQSLQFLFERTGLEFVARKGTEILASRLLTWIAILTGQRLKIPALKQMSAEHHIPLTGTKNVNSKTTVKVLKQWQPDLIISIYFNQLIRQKVIDLASIGVINIHPALLPKNRGLFPYFWALANGDDETGVTVHWVDRKFDTGDILVQKRLAITSEDTVTSLAQRCAEEGASLLVEAVNLIEAGHPPHLPQTGQEASYYSWPTPAAFKQFKEQGRQYGSLFEIWKILRG